MDQLNEDYEVTCFVCKKSKPGIILSKDASVCYECGQKISATIKMMWGDSASDGIAEEEPVFTGMAAVPKPSELKRFLDEYVVGQENAKRVLSVAAYNHYKRIYDTNGTIRGHVEKSNILLVGPTGCGKTHLVSTLAKRLNVSYACVDANSLTEAGYIGQDVESCLTRLLIASNMDVEKAEHGIVFIDEIDKLVDNSNGRSGPARSGVQQALLKLIESSESVAVPVSLSADKMGGAGKTVTMDTRNILFICGGAFSGIESVIEKRLACSKKSIGFGALVEDEQKNFNIMSNVIPQDIVAYGLVPEFVGRLPIVVALEEMTAEMLARVLVEPKDSIYEQYKCLLRADEVDLKLGDGAAEAIGEKALALKSGARSLRSVMEGLMQDVMYEIPDRDDIGSVVLTREYVNGENSLPDYIYREEEAFRKVV